MCGYVVLSNIMEFEWDSDIVMLRYVCVYYCLILYLVTSNVTPDLFDESCSYIYMAEIHD